MRFSDAKTVRVAEIHRQSVEVHSEGAIKCEEVLAVVQRQ